MIKKEKIGKPEIDIKIKFSKEISERKIQDLVERFIKLDKLPEKIATLFRVLDGNVKVDIVYEYPKPVDKRRKSKK